MIKKILIRMKNITLEVKSQITTQSYGRINNMINLKLITTENFGTIPCDFYRNMNDDILLTREQIGSALEYTNPRTAIKNIHRKHRDRLDQLSIKVKLGGCQNEPTLKSEKQERVYYTERGIMEICRWSRQPLANQFMDWCWDVIEKYRNNQGFNNPNIDALTNAITTLTQTIATMQQDISDIKETQSQMQQKNTSRKKSMSRWTKRMFPKYQSLMDYFHVDRTELYHNLFIELQNINPEIDLTQMKEDYLDENGLDKCFTMEVIEHNTQVRTLFEYMVDNLLNRFELKPDAKEEYKFTKTIFEDV